MNNWMIYLLEVNTCLVALYICYALIFRRLSFFYIKRAVVLSTIFASLCIPSLQFPRMLEQSKLISSLPVTLTEWEKQIRSPKENNSSEVISNASKVLSATNHPSHQWDLITGIYLLGVCIFLLNFSRRIYSLLRIIYYAQSKYIDGYWQILINQQYSFSFGPYIFFSKDHQSLTKEEKQMILCHEKVHVLQWHTLDILLVELLQIMCWFNPVMILIKRELRNIHEYTADRKVTEKYAVKHYAQLLLKLAVRTPHNLLIHSFSIIPLKKRILMMKQKPSHRWKLLGVLPVVVLAATMWFTLSSYKYQKTDESQSQSITMNPSYTVSNTNGLSLNLFQLFDPPSIYPTESKEITSGYGMRMNPYFKREQFHTGVDFKAELRSEVYATGDGVVIFAGDSQNGYGYVIEINHGNNIITKYSHLDANGIKVSTHQKVKVGEVIGLSGNSGLSKGPHLHYEVWKDGKHVNPKEYFPGC